MLFYSEVIPVPSFRGSQQIEVNGLTGSITFEDPPAFLKRPSKISYIFLVFPKFVCNWYKVSQTIEQHGFMQAIESSCVF